MSSRHKKNIFSIKNVELTALTLLGIAATLIMFGNAVSRYLFKVTFVWAEETIRILFVWSMFIAVTTSFFRNDHIGFNGLSRRIGLPNLIYRIIYPLSLACVGGILCINGYRYNALTGSILLPGTNLPTALFMWPGIIAGAIWAILGIWRLMKIFIRTSAGVHTK